MKRINRGHILALPAVLMMPMAMLAPKGLAALFVVSALAALAWSRFYKEPVRWPPVALILPFGAFIAYAALSSLWSPTPLVSLKTSTNLGLMTFGGLVLVSCARALESTEKRLLARALLIGAVLSLVLFGVEKLTGFGVWRQVMAIKLGLAEMPPPSRGMIVYNPAMSVAVLFVWPLFFYWFGERRLFALTGVLFVLVIALWSEAETPALAVGLGILTAMAFWRAQSKMRMGLAGGVIALMFVSPLLPDQAPGPETIRSEMPYLSHSAIHRIMIWKVAAKHIAENPVAGLGMDTTRSLYGRDTKVSVTYPPPKSGGVAWAANFEPIPLHPHNVIIQVWLELGGIGIAGLAWIVISLVRVIKTERGRHRGRSALIMGFYVSSLAVASLSFGAWQSWWVCTLWLAASLLIAQLPAVEEKKPQ